MDLDERKFAVVREYKDLAKSHARTSAALAAFADALSHTTDVKHAAALIEGLPLELPAAAHASIIPSAAVARKAIEAPIAFDSDPKKGKKDKKAKKLKDPNAPKRPPSAYIEYQNAVRQQFRLQQPEMPYPEVLRKIAETWSAMSEEQKKTWQEITTKKAGEYDAAKKVYDAAHPPGTLNGDISVNEIPQVTVGKDGKEYTGKKRGRKSAADKVKDGNPATPSPPLHAHSSSSAAAVSNADLAAIAKAVEGAVPRKEKKEKKHKSEHKGEHKVDHRPMMATAPVPVPHVAPIAPSLLTPQKPVKVKKPKKPTEPKPVIPVKAPTPVSLWTQINRGLSAKKPVSRQPSSSSDDSSSDDDDSSESDSDSDSDSSSGDDDSSSSSSSEDSIPVVSVTPRTTVPLIIPVSHSKSSKKRKDGMISTGTPSGSSKKTKSA